MSTLLRWWWSVRTCARNVWGSRLSALAATGSITLALTLTCAGILLGQQIERVGDHWTGQVDVTVYLCTRASTAPSCDGVAGPAQVAAVGDVIGRFPGVESVRFENRDAAWAAFSERFAGSELLGNVDAGALPESYRLRVSPSADREKLVTALTAALTAVGGVETVQDQRALLSGFFTTAERIRAGALALAGLQAAVSVALLAHLLRSSVERRREDIRVMSLVGTPRRQIRGPFVLEGLAVCTAGTALSAGAVLTGLDLARDLVTRFAGEDLLLDDASAAAAIARVAVLGTLAGWVTVRVTLARRVRETR